MVFFGLAGFSFLITQYFQFFRCYGPLSTGVHLLPVALAVGVTSVVDTKLAVSLGTKQVVTAGMFCLAAFFARVATASVHTRYLEIAGQMVLGGSGVGRVSAPATEAIMGVVPKAKAGIGSAVNDATRLLGSTLGIAVVGSIYASIYRDHVADRLPAAIAPQLTRTARDSFGGGLNVATSTGRGGHPELGNAVHAAASSAFFDGFHTSLLILAVLSALGGLMTVLLLPAHPVVPADSEEAEEARAFAALLEAE